MREDHEEPVFELQKWFDGSDIFYRPQDKQRLQFALDAIVDDELGLAVIGDNEAVLAHYCKILLAKLREMNGFEIEVFLPMNTVSLLKRFNELLASMSVDEARQPPVADKPVTLLVVNDANEIQEDQWSLLTRLLSDFPGVNVRLVLFIDKNAWPEYETPLEQLGRKLYRWALETATLAEAIELMRAARQYGFQRQTETLLLESGLGAAIEGSYADPDLKEGADALPADDSDNPFPEQGMDFLDGGIDDYADPLDLDISEGEPKAKRTLLPMALVFVLAMAVAWATLSRLSSGPEGGYTAKITETINEIKSRPDKGLGKPMGAEKPVAKIGQNPDLKSASKPAQTSQAQAVVKQIQQDRQQSEQPKPIKKPKAPAPRPIPKKPSPSIAEPEQPAANSKNALFSKSIARVQGARANDFFVQHIVLSTDVQAADYIERYASLRKAMVLPIKSGQKTVYAIISGPFSTKPKAEAFAERASMPSDFWVRAAGQLRDAM
jgi:hypothetical protein